MVRVWLRGRGCSNAGIKGVSGCVDGQGHERPRAVPPRPICHDHLRRGHDRGGRDRVAGLRHRGAPELRALLPGPDRRGDLVRRPVVGHRRGHRVHAGEPDRRPRDRDRRRRDPLLERRDATRRVRRGRGGAGEAARRPSTRTTARAHRPAHRRRQLPMVRGRGPTRDVLLPSLRRSALARLPGPGRLQAHQRRARARRR